MTVSVNDLLVFLALVAFVGVAGVVVGMLVLAPRMMRLTDRETRADEESGDRTDN